MQTGTAPPLCLSTFKALKWIKWLAYHLFSLNLYDNVHVDEEIFVYVI